MLEALRGKRMLFAGDSLSRGQFTSMVCLLQGLVPENGKSMKSSYDSLSVFRLKDYNATIEFYWAPLLLESNGDGVGNDNVTERIIRKGSMDKHGKFWEGADVVVFGTYIWWMTSLKLKILKGSFTDEVKEFEILKPEDAYRMGIQSMLEWAERNMDPKKTRVFFTGMSPSHTRSIHWGGEPDGNCYNERTPIEKITIPRKLHKKIKKHRKFTNKTNPKKKIGKNPGKLTKKNEKSKEDDIQVLVTNGCEVEEWWVQSMVEFSGDRK